MRYFPAPVSPMSSLLSLRYGCVICYAPKAYRAGRSSGGKGIQVVAPLPVTISHDEAHSYTNKLARQLAASDPKRLTLSATLSQRKGRPVHRLLAQWTAVGTYSPHARPAFPVTWRDVESGARPDQYTMQIPPPDVEAGHSARLQLAMRSPWDVLVRLYDDDPCGPRIRSGRRIPSLDREQLQRTPVRGNVPARGIRRNCGMAGTARGASSRGAQAKSRETGMEVRCKNGRLDTARPKARHILERLVPALE